MLFHVRMDVKLPLDMPLDVAEQLKATERARFQELQRSGVWRHIWRIVGQYANVSIFDVDSPAQLHEYLTSLPLFPYMQIEVMPLCRHASSLHEDDR
jgi:muconolactone D-isomerase